MLHIVYKSVMIIHPSQHNLFSPLQELPCDSNAPTHDLWLDKNPLNRPYHVPAFVLGLNN